MKNIHVLSTDKPSRLYFHKLNHNLVFSELPMEYTGSGTWIEGRNIYITSDEEIKERDWVTNSLTIMRANLDGQPTMDDYHPWKKIILTTDKELIKDGVQAIDDNFLEWFVKNPSCEFVEINKYAYAKPNFGNYKIIIPKEEPKQRLEKYSERFDNKDNEIVEGVFNPDTWGKRVVEEPKQELPGINGQTFKIVLKEKWFPKQETLEEVAERFYGEEEIVNDYDISGYLQSAFLTGAKWQAERMYSEEEVRKSLLDIVLVNPAHISLLKSGYGQFPDTFELTEKGVDYILEQFKKK